jgi:hypothetical protein
MRGTTDPEHAAKLDIRGITGSTQRVQMQVYDQIGPQDPLLAVAVGQTKAVVKT